MLFRSKELSDKNKDIHLFVPTFDIPSCLSQIQQCLEKGWTGLGDKTVEFEQAFCERFNHPNAHFLNSATAGLHLAVKILKQFHGWQDGDEIITTPFTFVSTNHAILYENLQPIFADIDDYLCLDPECIAQCITPRTRAIMFVGIGGNTGQWQEVVNLCRQRKLAIILDAAHMTGTRLDGKNPALSADASIYSFQAVKNLPTADAGMVCFAEKEHDIAARKLAWLGIDKDTYTRTQSDNSYRWYYEVDDIGYKYHGNAIMAAIGLSQLDCLESDNDYRRTLAKNYRSRLAMIEGITLIPTAPNCMSSQHLFQILVDQRDEVMLELNKRRIYPGVHYRDNTEYAMYRYGQGQCPRAHTLSRKVMSLPLHLRLVEADIDRVTNALAEIVNY